MSEKVLSSHIILSQINEIPVLRIQNSKASATISLQGAQLIEYTPLNGENLLFVSEGEPFILGKAIRGGIPICWPWFGPHPTEQTAPAHGLVRDKQWDYEIAVDTPQRTEIIFKTKSDPQNDFFPHAARAELMISIGDSVVLSLTTHNDGPVPLQVSQALHTYFACPTIADVQLQGLQGEPYFNQVTRSNAHFPSNFTFDQETDWVVQDKGQPIVLAGLKTPIKINRLGSHSVVVWNPWIEKSKTLSHFRQDDYQRMFCVEASNALEDTRLVKPAQAHTLILELSTPTAAKPE